MFFKSAEIIKKRVKFLLKSLYFPQRDVLYTFKKFTAFTLAEVLITLLIIGVIASLVIPQIIQDTQDAELKTALKATYSSLSNATKLLTIDNGGTIKGLFTNTVVMRDLYADKMNTLKRCNTSNAPGNCWHMNKIGVLKRYDGGNRGDYATTDNSIILTNGTFIAIRSSYSNCDGQYAGLVVPISCGMIRVDINGFKGPNVHGRDIFDFHVLPTSVSPRGGLNDSVHSCSGDGDYCAYSVLNNQ